MNRVDREHIRILGTQGDERGPSQTPDQAADLVRDAVVRTRERHVEFAHVASCGPV